MLGVNLAGVELEGAWDVAPPSYAGSPYGEWGRDGSVVGLDCRWSVGEAKSPPCNHWGKLKRWILDNHPHKVNHTCGTHVHMSFGPATKLRILGIAEEMLPFQSGLFTRLREWGAKQNLPPVHELYRRMDGYCGHCVPHNTDRREQVIDRGVSRYRSINLAALRKHGTVEIRVLPAFSKPALTVGAVRLVLAYTGEWMRKHGLRPPLELAVTQDAPAPENIAMPQAQSVPITVTYDPRPQTRPVDLLTKRKGM